MTRLFYILTIVFLTNNLTFGQLTDSIQTNSQTEQTQSNLTTETETEEFEDIDDFAPGLFFFALFAFVFILICVGAGIVLTVVGLLILFGLIGAGILSASILVGLNKKSFTKGFKTFLLSTTTIGGLLIGMTGVWILNKITHWWTLQTTLLTGSISGLLAGLVFGLFAFYVIQKLTTFLKTKLKAN
jgi:hypothetical protein